jgi:hypothetical protein
MPVATAALKISPNPLMDMSRDHIKAGWTWSNLQVLSRWDKRNVALLVRFPRS